MIGISDILAARGKDITDWMDILGPILLMVLYGIVWVINKAVELANKKRAQSEAEVTAEKVPVRQSPPKTSPLNRAVPIKKQSTLSQELGRLAGQVMSQANLQNRKPADSPNQTPLPQRRPPMPPKPAPQSRPQPAPASAIPQQPRPLVRSRPQSAPITPTPQRTSPPVQRPQPRPVPAVTAAQSPRSPVAAAIPAKPPTATHSQTPKTEHVPTAPQFLGSLLGDRENLFEAIILSEILGPPLSLRPPDSRS